jgi:hypothetical protein
VTRSILLGDCRNPSCHRPGDPFCWVCLNSLDSAQLAQLARAKEDGLVEYLGTAIALGRALAGEL